MKFVELEPQFIARTANGYRTVDTLADAEGILFLCPVCYLHRDAQLVGVHSIICWRPTVPVEVSPGPGRWEPSTGDFNTMTFNAQPSSSVMLSGAGCKAHFWVIAGEVSLCG